MNAPFNRHVGLIVIDVTMSNPNGDPDMESEPRTRDNDGLGIISPVSFKRKIRDLVAEDHNAGRSPIFEEAKKHLKLDDELGFDILEQRYRDRNAIIKMGRSEFIKRYWDARLFGNTFLESAKEDAELKARKDRGELEHFINTGVLQVGVGMSMAPVTVTRMSTTNKSGVQGGKDRGMAPLGFRVVEHGIYTIPIFVNPSVAIKTGATKIDLELFKFIVPHVYPHTSSAIRPQISVLHAWFAEHKNVLGSCPEYIFIEALTPTVKSGISKPTKRADYDIPDSVPEEIEKRFHEIKDLNDLL